MSLLIEVLKKLKDSKSIKMLEVIKNHGYDGVGLIKFSLPPTSDIAKQFLGIHADVKFTVYDWNNASGVFDLFMECRNVCTYLRDRKIEELEGRSEDFLSKYMLELPGVSPRFKNSQPFEAFEVFMLVDSILESIKDEIKASGSVTVILKNGNITFSHIDITAGFNPLMEPTEKTISIEDISEETVRETMMSLIEHNEEIKKKQLTNNG